DVKFPGLYNLSSFSTVKDLLIVARGVKKSASVREIIVKRNSKVIAKLDFYDLLFIGKNFATVLLKHGDIVVIQKAKKLVSIDGYVNNAALFELKSNETLFNLIAYAGGMKPNASKAEIKVDRYSNNEQLKTFKVKYKDSKKFQMKDGDRVYIYPLDFTAKNSINVYGNVIRPGSYNLNAKKTLNEFFRVSLKDGLQKFFLPNTYLEYGVIQKYNKDLQYTTSSFNLKKVINGEEIVKIDANDKIYIFSFSDIYSNAYITTVGSILIKGGKLQYFAGMTIEDAVNASGIQGVLDDKVRLTTYATDDFMPQTSFYSLEREGSTPLNPYDELEVYDYYSTHILEPVSIKGEVVKPTRVYYESNMTAADLLNVAGGFNKTAYTKSLSILRYYVDEMQTRQQKVLNYDLGEVSLEDILLAPYDEVKISKILGWGAQNFDTLSISGEVNNPATVKYGKGMTLEDLVIMAGGFTKQAYNRKIELVRYHLDENQTRQRTILKIDIKDKLLSEIKLNAYDKVQIFRIPKWNENKSVVLRGEVKFPGVYPIANGEKLSSIIRRAGGFTDEAFVKGTVFTRESIKKHQVAQYNQSLAKINRELAIYNAMPANAKQSVSSTSAGALDDVLKKAQKYEPLGRVSIELSLDLDALANSEYNLVLKHNDTITIPGKIDTVTVFGEVFNSSSFVYDSNLDGDDYIKMASGVSRSADEGSIYVIHPDGTSEPLSAGWFSASVDIQAGDTIVVPLFIKELNTLDVWDSVARILTSFAITAATMQTIGIF
ncbi:MAG TPA: hypothetical protein EYO75_01605, partial [Sulfurimonas sp.]|nr:hypothetical protein [Sulfurimonas sp.]